MTHKVVGNSKKVNNPERSFQINSLPFSYQVHWPRKIVFFELGFLDWSGYDIGLGSFQPVWWNEGCSFRQLLVLLLAAAFGFFDCTSSMCWFQWVFLSFFVCFGLYLCFIQCFGLWISNPLSYYFSSFVSCRSTLYSEQDTRILSLQWKLVLQLHWRCPDTEAIPSEQRIWSWLCLSFEINTLCGKILFFSQKLCIWIRTQKIVSFLCP